MSANPTRRELLLSLASLAAFGAPAAAIEAPPGSARYLLEVIFFRLNGANPPAMPAPPLAVATTIPGRIEVLGEDGWQLASAEAALKASASFTPLAHLLLAAVVPQNGRTTAKLEELLAPGTPLAGSIAIQRSQYLFLAVDVDYQSPEGALYPLRERRRLKFGETHYFDHPAFGLIARVTAPRGNQAND